MAVRQVVFPIIGGQLKGIGRHASPPQTALWAVWERKESNFSQKSVLRRLHDWSISANHKLWIANISPMAMTKYHNEKRARGGIDLDGRRGGCAENVSLSSFHQERSWGWRAPRGFGVPSPGLGSLFVSLSIFLLIRSTVGRVEASSMSIHPIL